MEGLGGRGVGDGLWDWVEGMGGGAVKFQSFGGVKGPVFVSSGLDQKCGPIIIIKPETPPKDPPPEQRSEQRRVNHS